MKLLTFERNGSASYGAVVDGGVVDLGARLSDLPTLKSVLEAGALDRLRETAARASADFGTAEITFLQTIPDAGRILCVGQNYRKHIEEMGRPAPAYPNVFVRHPDGQVGHGGEMVAPSSPWQNTPFQAARSIGVDGAASSREFGGFRDR